VKDKPEELDKILALQDVVIDEVRYADIPLAYTGYKVRRPQEVWASANGNALEKAILLSRMLVAVGINAFPVATVPNGWFSMEMGNLAEFDGYMVQVNPHKMGKIYLSVNQKQSQNLVYEVLDKTMIQLDPNLESMRTFQEKPEMNLLKMEAELTLSADKNISGEIEVDMEAYMNPFFKIHRDSSYVKSVIIGDISASQMSEPDFKTLSELKTSAEIDVTAAPVKTDLSGYLFFELPRYKTGFDSWGLYQFTTSGNTPVKFEHHLWEEYSYKITIPDGYTLFTPPVDLNIKNMLGVLSIRISQKGNEITIFREFELSHNVVTSSDMDEFKEMAKAWENGNWRKIVFKVQ
jgi:hypothetical protein